MLPAQAGIVCGGTNAAAVRYPGLDALTPWKLAPAQVASSSCVTLLRHSGIGATAACSDTLCWDSGQCRNHDAGVNGTPSRKPRWMP